MERKLSRYRAKRDFQKTAEPQGGEPVAGAPAAYLIQKHAARRLHYDFRLEMDGVLKSWAVTRGPSLDPADKRLAVHVEDHPLDYGSFEGTIPKGQYGGGTVMLWDRGTWEPVGDGKKMYAKGHMRVRLHGERLKGDWHLVRMAGKAGTEKHDNWLLIKAHDESAKEGDGDAALTKYETSVTTGRTMEKIAEAAGPVWNSNRAAEEAPARKTRKAAAKTARAAAVTKTAAGTTKTTKAGAKTAMAMKAATKTAKPTKAATKPTKAAQRAAPPEFVTPQLATLVGTPPGTADWVHEVKFDGYRAIARLADGEVTLLTRAANDWTDRFRGVAEALAKLPLSSAVLDGEIVTLDDHGNPSFAGLQQALKNDDQSLLHYYAFDLLFLNGHDLRGERLVDRKELLRKVIPEQDARLHYSEHFAEPGPKVLAQACRLGLEGIISKRADAAYSSGRSEAWRKCKCLEGQELVVGGFTHQPKHPGTLGALLLGYHDDGKLVFAGKAGTGFSHAEAVDLLKRLKPLAQDEPPFASVPPAYRKGAVWTRPNLVVQVQFTEWTRDGVLRHPAFQGLREDKAAKDVVREKKKHLPGKGAVTSEAVQAMEALEEVVAPDGKERHHRAKSAEAPVPRRGGVIVAGIAISNPEKLLYPEAGITKQALAGYYEAVADWMLPHIAGRPISLLRCPDGSGKNCFFQRHAGAGISEHIETIKAEVKGDSRPYLKIENIKGLLAIVQMGVLEIHVWGSHADRPDLPDRIVFDLDPADDVPWRRVKEAALELRLRLKDLGLDSFLKTTGGKGLHVVVPFTRGPGWPEAKGFSRAVALAMAKDAPTQYTLNMRKAERAGRIFVDYLRNDLTATAIAPYSTRARPDASVAVPLRWEDLESLTGPAQFTVKTLPGHLARIKHDPWSEMARTRQQLPAP